MNQNLREPITHGSAEYPFALYHIRASLHAFNVSLHWHDEVEIIYIKKGNLHLIIDKDSYLGTAGDIFIVNSQEIHEMSVEELPTEYYTILFPLSSFIFRNSDNSNTNFLLPLAEQKMRFRTHLSLSEKHAIYKAKVEELIDIYQQKDTAYQLGTKCGLLSLIYLLYRDGEIKWFRGTRIDNPNTHGTGCTLSSAIASNQLHRDILHYINENFLEPIYLDDIAFRFHMAPKYFSRYFKNVFHTTLTEYIMQLRLEKAISLLNSGKFSVTEAALQSGFSSCSYFNKCFKKVFGKSPKKYLQDIISNHSA